MINGYGWWYGINIDNLLKIRQYAYCDGAIDGLPLTQEFKTKESPIKMAYYPKV